MNRLLSQLTRTGNLDALALAVRVWLGAMMTYHGYGKLFGDMAGFAGYLSKLGVPLPEVSAWLAAGAEFVGGLLLMVGFLSVPAAAFVLFTMAVAAFVAHAPDGFDKKEQALTYGVMALAVLIGGAGRWSIDAMLHRR